MLIQEKCIFLDEKLTRKDDVLEMISKVAVDIGVSDDYKDVLNSFKEREGLGSTGMINEFAIPHAKSKSISESQIIFIKNNVGIDDWETLDESKVKLIIALLVPDENNEEHLKILSNISKRLMNPEYVDKLKGSNSKSEIIELLSI